MAQRYAGVEEMMRAIRRRHWGRNAAWAAVPGVLVVLLGAWLRGTGREKEPQRVEEAPETPALPAESHATSPVPRVEPETQAPPAAEMKAAAQGEEKPAPETQEAPASGETQTAWEVPETTAMPEDDKFYRDVREGTKAAVEYWENEKAKMWSVNWAR